MVVENNAIRPREIKSAITEDNNIFENIQTVSISTTDRALKRHQMNMKQLYTVPFERTGERVGEMVTELQLMCQANGVGISENGVLTHIPIIGPYNEERLVTFCRHSQQGSHPWTREGSDWRWLAKVWDSLGLRPTTGCWWSSSHPTPHSLTTLRNFSQHGDGKYMIASQMTLLAAMDAACDDITADACRGWIRHSKWFFPRCIAREDLRCDVDEKLWPNRRECQDV